MRMTPIAPIFDTNVYQEIGHSRLHAICVAEQRLGVRAFADPFVVLEFVAKVAQPTKKDRRIGRASLNRLWQHCGGPDLRYSPDAEERGESLFLGRTSATHNTLKSWLADIAEAVHQCGDDELPADTTAKAKAFEHNVSRIETEMVARLFEVIVQSVVPEASTWEAIKDDAEVREAVLSFLDVPESLDALAAGEIVKAHKALGEAPPDPLPREMLDKAVSTFRFGLEVQRNLIRQMAAKGMDLSKYPNPNTIWDIQIGFNVGQTVGGTPIQLVSRDSLLHETAAYLGEPSHVWRIDRYEREIGIAA